MSRELTIENLEKAVCEMGESLLRRKSHSVLLKLSDYAIGLGFTAQSAEEFIKQEMENPTCH